MGLHSVGFSAGGKVDGISGRAPAILAVYFSTLRKCDRVYDRNTIIDSVDFPKNGKVASSYGGPPPEILWADT